MNIQELEQRRQKELKKEKKTPSKKVESTEERPRGRRLPLTRIYDDEDLLDDYDFFPWGEI